MSLMRRVRLGSSSGARASASAPQTGSVTPQTSTSSLQASGSHAGDNAEESTALSRMKTAAGLALDVIQKGLRLSAEATSDVAIPGLSIGLSALAEILEMVQVRSCAVVVFLFAKLCSSDHENHYHWRGRTTPAHRFSRRRARCGSSAASGPIATSDPSGASSPRNVGPHGQAKNVRIARRIAATRC